MSRLTVKQVAQSYADGKSAEYTGPCRGGGSLHHDGKRAYSYGVCIAEKKGPSYVVVTLHKYSVTTSKHCTQVRLALLKEGWSVGPMEPELER